MDKEFSRDLARPVRAEFASTSPLCRHCHNPTVDVLIMKTDVIWWWCAGCGHVWGQPQKPRGDAEGEKFGGATAWGDVAMLGPKSRCRTRQTPVTRTVTIFE